ncbi:phosphatidylinositol:UDP-GlcNAc transferase PIG-C [Cordyceps fumosorosea ARSEF 2679]|uniref:Phosphatidylinositol:UDP-GlcNAc transferase PIG-C n=1 Tax=Cordyceps fumosorosea (strain ARSEF 2679) TaxID=1081104 RepID=A0A162MXG0_CORFA|nr:phosphatidylinositol:UDP-GlcNAc transferase PIG-C [Cordyceps fumosorosea ARSEF 2679]OAA72169.1 phosphatidylinositol:UDP-GlcNAc transferase PIG-C [Cordyceps fumosorosea ARSEF 2679]
MPSPTDDEIPFPPLSSHHHHRSHLSPNDACVSPPRRYEGGGGTSGGGVDGAADSAMRMRRLNGERSGSRRRKRTWKKLMWVKQSYPDNYTDQATFLENLQRNPRLKPYDFWPLVADSTVILQHVCSVIIFVVSFVAIFHSRVSPVAVVSWSSVGTFLGWILWERWVAEEEDLEVEQLLLLNGSTAAAAAAASPSGAGSGSTTTAAAAAAAATLPAGPIARRRTRAGSLRRPVLPIPPPSTAGSSAASSATNLTLGAVSPPPASISRATSAADVTSTTTGGDQAVESKQQRPSLPPRSSAGSEVRRVEFAYPTVLPGEESRLMQRLGTIKSAVLIYSTLLGLSPILKSLTRSTSSDSIWAMSFWLLAINIFFFDYSGGVPVAGAGVAAGGGSQFPASLSTNAALMASTVLASRLPDTTQVFSLTLFSIQVFGLFPVFRRHVRHRAWRYHVLLTVLLVLGAGLGVGMVLGDGGDDGAPWPWRRGLVGMVVSLLIAALAAGGCSWWLIGLQKYKNEIRGPWDPARPIIMSRPRWD